MQYLRLEIGKETYDMLSNKSRSEVSSYVEDNLISDSIKWGYGYYGCNMPVYDKDTNEYYIMINIGSTCD